MTHIKVTHVPQGTMPRDLKVGFRMQRTKPPAEVVRVETPPQCLPVYNGWAFATDPDPPNQTEGFTITITPAEGTDTCGECLDWIAAEPLQLYLAEGDAPVIESVEPLEDCIGMVATIAPNAGATQYNWELIFHAFLHSSSQPFGLQASYAYGPPPGVAAHEWNTAIDGSSYTGVDAHYPNSDGSGGDEIWVCELTLMGVADPGTLDWNYTITEDPDFAAAVTITDVSSELSSEDQLTMRRLRIQYDDNTLPTPEGNNWSLSLLPLDGGNPSWGTLTLSKVA